jgi:hypothetical protein
MLQLSIIIAKVNLLKVSCTRNKSHNLWMDFISLIFMHSINFFSMILKFFMSILNEIL